MVLCLVSPFFLPRATAWTSRSRACASLPAWKAVSASRFRSSIFREDLSVVAQALNARTNASGRGLQRRLMRRFAPRKGFDRAIGLRSGRVYMSPGLEANATHLYDPAPMWPLISLAFLVAAPDAGVAFPGQWAPAPAVKAYSAS